MKNIDRNNPLGKNIVQVSNALFVLSQVAIKRKLEINSLKNQLNLLKVDSSSDTAEIQKQIKQLSKIQQYFHAERTEIFRCLIQNNMVSVKGFIASDGYNYGVVKISKHKFYIILNKKIIEFLKLGKIGEKLDHIEALSDLELENIMPIKEAEKVFNLFLVKVRQRNKKANKSKDKSNVPVEVTDRILSKSTSTSGSIIVIKKRKFSGLVSTN
jgi:hypothetical protein